MNLIFYVHAVSITQDTKVTISSMSMVCLPLPEYPRLSTDLFLYGLSTHSLATHVPLPEYPRLLTDQFLCGLSTQFGYMSTTA